MLGLSRVNHEKLWKLLKNIRSYENEVALLQWPNTS